MTPDPIDALAALPPPTPPALGGELEATLGSLQPVSMRRPVRQLVMLCTASLLYGAGVLAVVATRRDAGELPTAWMLGAGAAWLFGFVVPCHLALVPRAGSVVPRWRLAAISAVVTAITFLLLGLVIHPSGPSSVHYGTERFLDGHVCLEIGLATALVPIVLGTICLRGALPVGSRWIAAALGAGGGSLGGLVLHLHCHVTDPLHLSVAHGGVVLVAAVLAATMVPRAADVR